MAGISPDLRNRLQDVLAHCGPFDSNAALYTSFTDARIAAWRDRIPDSAYNRAERITALIDALHDQYNIQGENALVLFLHVLYEHTPADDHCHQELATLADELEQYAPAPDTPQWDAALDCYREWVKRAYGTMRVLGKHEPVSVEGIYTDVYMLEKPAASRYLDPQGGSSTTQGERRDGLRLVMQPGNEHLVVLGQPGAGKTTFLKHIALKAAEGQLGDYVPVLVYLREWTGDDLMEFLTRPLSNGGIADPSTLMEHLLRTGRVLLLLDGLDEVNDPQRPNLIQSIEEFHRRYVNCRILLTCRVAATPHQFESFHEVEVADFTDEQMQAFATRWFGEGTTKTEAFQREIRLDEHLRDLGRTPLLLGMLCFTFDEQGTFPEERAELYQRGLDALLIEWDESRSIKREAMRRAEIYHNLLLGRKHQLFAYIANATFERGETLISQERLERLIGDYLVTAPNVPARIDIDSAAILKAIEAQHGILVKYAQRVYTFAHPTFQEYYTAQCVVSSAASGDHDVVRQLLTHAADDRWREVILLTASLLDEADGFFTHFLDALDVIVCDEARLTDFFTWATHKAISANMPYKLAAVRAYYINLALDRAHYRASARADDLERTADRAYHPTMAAYSDVQRAFDRASALAYASNFARDRASALARDRNLALDRDFADIGHDWYFTRKQAETLEQYCRAASLLVECLDIAHVTDRAAIEARLLLPPGYTEEA